MKTITLTEGEFRAILDMRMVIDPESNLVDLDKVDRVLDQAAIQFGYTNWFIAYADLSGIKI